MGGSMVVPSRYPAGVQQVTLGSTTSDHTFFQEFQSHPVHLASFFTALGLPAEMTWIKLSESQISGIPRSLYSEHLGNS